MVCRWGCSLSVRNAVVALSMVMVSVSGQAQNAEGYRSSRVLEQGRAPAVAARVEEGWALYSFLVNPDGQVEDLVLLDSSGSGRAVDVTKERLQGITFQSATMDGVPVLSARREQMVLGMEGVSGNPDFLKDYNAFSDAMAEQEFEYAGRILGRMGERRIRGIHEFALLSLGRFQLGTTQGMPLEEQILHLYRALSDSSGDVIPDSVRQGVQQSLVQALLQTNRFAEATAAYAQVKPDLDNNTIARFDAAFERVSAIKSSEQVYAVNGKLSDTGAWLLPLYKSGFGVTEGLEKLERAQLRCSVGSYNVALKPEADYQFPENARSCSLLMQGEPGANVTLVQF